MSDARALGICIFFLIPFTGVYVSLGGLWGVLWTDLFQFVLKMSLVTAVAYFGVRAAGGMHALLAHLAAMRAATKGGAADITAIFPDFSRGWTSEALWTLPVMTFAVHLCVQWWAFWYPGAEPGGGGYVAQRIFSARDEREGLLSVLWFNIAQYAVRPWPWIITALVAVVLYPGLAHPESGYMRVAIATMPPALRGVLIAGFLAAFMSTIATQLNWGTSYLIEDFYRRFLKRGANERHYVVASRVVTLLLVAAAAYVSAQLATIGQGWQIVLEVGAGTGGVYLLRWYWWRINAWSEISAMAAALVTTLYLHWRNPFQGNASLLFAKTTLTTTRNHHACLDRRDFAHACGAGRIVAALLPQGAAARGGLAAHRFACAGDCADARSRAQSLLLAAGMRDGVRGAFRGRTILFRAIRRGCGVGRSGDCVRSAAVSGDWPAHGARCSSWLIFLQRRFRRARSFTWFRPAFSGGRSIPLISS